MKYQIITYERALKCAIIFIFYSSIWSRDELAFERFDRSQQPRNQNSYQPQPNYDNRRATLTPQSEFNPSAAQLDPVKVSRVSFTFKKFGKEAENHCYARVSFFFL